MGHAKILIVDDEPEMLEICSDTLTQKGLPVRTESSSLRALELIKNDDFDLLLLDIKIPEIDGITFLKKTKEITPNLPVIMLTGFPTIETAVESMKLGAFDYLTKPFTPEQLSAAVERALEHKRLKDENILLTHHLEHDYKFDDLIGQSDGIKQICELIKQVADSEVDVLINGESGTGKELVARSIHNHSSRKRHRFVPIDCGAIPENLLENELFGHERGAFTDARHTTMGLLEFAHQGTLFLDEVCELPIGLQAKLLRTLQERQFRKLGGKNLVSINVRVVAATNRNIEEEVKAQRFREDLFYRLNVFRINIPPLHQRPEDIQLLISYFLQRYNKEMNKNIITVEPEIMEMIESYPWPGNVRELQNILKRMMVLSKPSTLSLDSLPEEISKRVIEISRNGTAPDSFFYLRNNYLNQFEQDYFNKLLKQFKGNVTEAAQKSGLPKGTFYRLLSKHQITPDSFRE